MESQSLRAFRGYCLANLAPLLEAIRRPGRYAGHEGVNALTNTAPPDSFRCDEVLTQLAAAEAAGLRKDASFAPQFSSSGQGFAYGLNPYTDWAVSQLQSPPTHYYLFLGLDWYSVSGLGNLHRWFQYLENPFVDSKDLYWHRIWAWILGRVRPVAGSSPTWDTPVNEAEAAAFVRTDGGAFIFHNRIPYLRPAGAESAGTDWYKGEWRKRAVQADAIADLATIRELAGERVFAICTSDDSIDALTQAGYRPHQVLSWRGHPSRVFHPSTTLARGIVFRGRSWFA